MPKAALAILALVPALLAQSGAPTLVSKDPLGGLVVDDVPTLRKQLEQSALGKLLAEPEVATAFQQAVRRSYGGAAHTERLWATVDRLGVAVEPWILSNRIASPFTTMGDLDLDNLVRFELMSSAPPDGQHRTPTAVTMTCLPRAEGRWTAQFEKRAMGFTKSKLWHALDDAKIDGYPGYAWAPAGIDESDPNFEFLRGTRLWMLHLPGTFANGTGMPQHCATIAPAPARGPAAATLTMRPQSYLKTFAAMGVGVPMEFALFGFDSLQEFDWQLRFDGEQLVDLLEVRFDKEPRGVIGALLTGRGDLPAQPLPEGALAQIRAAVDVPILFKALTEMAGGGLGGLKADDVGAAFTGGLALGITAPARGQVVPRIYLSAGIGDAEALDRVLQTIAANAKQKQVTYEQVPCTVLTIPGGPPALQPTWCKLDGVLHVAESGASMRAFLKARADGAATMDIGDVPVPEGPGEVMPFEVRADQAAMYATFVNVWLPLYSLAQGGRGRALLARDEMPTPEAMANHLGKSRGALRRDGNTFRLTQRGTLGGVDTAALAMVFGPMLSAEMNSDYSEAQLANAIGKHQLERVWAAIEKWKQAHDGKLPASLGELVQDGKLPADALLLEPEDPTAEVVPLPGDGKSIRSSYRYFPTPVEVDCGNVQGKALLIAVEPQNWNRSMLLDDGTTPDVWGEASQRPIDKFGAK